MDYTVIGDAVNVASRLEGLTKLHGTKIIMSEAVWEQIRGQVPARDLGPERVKGRQRPVHLFGLPDEIGVESPLSASAAS